MGAGRRRRRRRRRPAPARPSAGHRHELRREPRCQGVPVAVHQVRHGHLRTQLGQQVGQVLQRLARLAADAGLPGLGHRVAEGDPASAGEAGQLGHRGVAHAALGHVDDAPPADLVVGVDQHPQVGEDVLDLLAVVELGAAHHLVGDLAADHGLLEGPALGVGPVEDGDVTPPQALVAAQADDLVGHPLGLVVLVLGPVADDLVAGALVGPERLRLPGDVVGDDGVGGVEDGLGRAEVLVEGDGGGVRKGLLEVEDVRDVGAPESVDRLVAVPHHHDVAVAAGQLDGQRVLHGVGVLVLVDQDVGEAVAVVLEDVGVLVEEADGVQQQVVEVHGVGRQHAPLVEVEDVGDAAVEDGDGGGPELGRALLAGLGLADLAEHRAGRQLLGVDVELAGDDLDRVGGNRRRRRW